PSPVARSHSPAGGGSGPRGSAVASRYSSNSGPGRSASHPHAPSGGPAYGSGAWPARSSTVGTTRSTSRAAISASSSASWSAHTVAVAGWTRASSASRNRSPAGAGRCTALATTDGAGTWLTSPQPEFLTCLIQPGVSQLCGCCVPGSQYLLGLLGGGVCA